MLLGIRWVFCWESIFTFRSNPIPSASQVFLLANFTASPNRHDVGKLGAKRMSLAETVARVRSGVFQIVFLDGGIRPDRLQRDFDAHAV
jgi:hypothetical protein